MNRAGANSALTKVVHPRKVEASLWRRLRYEQENFCREELFKLYQQYAKKIAKKQFFRRPQYGLELLDFEQLAYSGLLQAIDRYDPLYCIPFEAFARRRIIGSIADGSVISSEKGAQYQYARRIEMERFNSIKTPNEDYANEGGALLQLTDLAVGLAIGFVLDEASVGNMEELPDQEPNAYETLSWRELQLSLVNAIETLPSQEDLVIKNHYIEGIAFVQIAQLLKITKGRVSQMHKSALLKLRKRLRSFF